MLSNTLIFGISVLLAGSLFLLPAIYRGAGRRRGMIQLTLHLGVFLGLALLQDLRSALAVAILGAILFGLGKALIVNFRMVHSANYPKHRRCY